jgi:hypothetical protein
MAYVWDQPLRLERWQPSRSSTRVLKPLLITEKQADDHHRGAREMVIQIALEDTELNQNACDQIHRAVPLVYFCAFQRLTDRCT